MAGVVRVTVEELPVTLLEVIPVHDTLTVLFCCNRVTTIVAGVGVDRFVGTRDSVYSF
jgi:hypothetical protein